MDTAANCLSRDRRAHGEIKATSRTALLATQHPDTDKLTLTGGRLDGKPVQVLMDAGSQVSIVKVSLVDPAKWSRESVKVRCVHGDRWLEEYSEGCTYT